LSYKLYDMTKLGSARINARIDTATAHKIEYIKRKTKRAVSEIIVTSLDFYYRSLKSKETNAKAILDAAGFIGCGSAAKDLSETYKQQLSASLAKKT
jgi:hypothetical protein